MATAAQLVAEVKVTGATEAKEQLKGMSGAVEETSGGFKSMLGNALSFAAGQFVFNAVGNAVGFLKDQFVDMIHQSMDSQEAMAQTEAVLKSTHDASGMTAQSVADLATQFSHLTLFSDDTIQSAENMLLTFTNIGKDVFPQATKTVLDMSQALGQDTKSSAIQLGKALNDPITGITALQRVGVTFTDSQKNLIKSLVDSGNVAGAQKIILQELQREFGNSAEAAGKTFPGQLQILSQSFDDIKQKIGDAVLPILQNLTGFVQSNVVPAFDHFADWFTKNGVPALQSFGGWLKTVKDYFGSFEITSVTNAFKNLGDAIGGLLAPLKGLGSNKEASEFFTNLRNDLSKDIVSTIKNVSGFINGLATDLRNLSSNKEVIGFISSLKDGFNQVKNIVGGEVGKNFQQFGQTVQQVGKWFQTDMLPAIKQAMPGFEHLASVIATSVVPSLAKIWAIGQQVAREVMPPLIQAFETVAPIVVRVGGFLADNLGKALQFIAPFVVQAAQELGKFASEIISRVVPFVQQMWNMIQGFLDWIKPYWPAIWNGLVTGLTSAWDTIKGTIQIAWSIVSGIIKIGLDVLSGNWKKVWEDVKSMFSGIWDGIKSIAQGVWNLVQKPIMDGIHAFQKTWNDVWNGTKKTFSDIWNSLSGIASGAWNNVAGAVRGGINSVIDAIDNFISGVNNIHVTLPGGVSLGFSIPLIPHLATGGLIGKAGMALVGERGPEQVFLPAGAQVIPHGQSFGPQSITVQPNDIYLDGMRLASALMPYIMQNIRLSTAARF